jgi:hypothetical protein
VDQTPDEHLGLAIARPDTCHAGAALGGREGVHLAVIRKRIPSRQWLKDRRGRSLSFDDITHYQRIAKILAETDRIMREIELPLPS